MRVAVTDPKTYLWQNICVLMKGAATIDAVTEKTGVGRGTIQRIKEGRTSVGTDVLVSIADAFEIDIPQLLTPTVRLAKDAPSKAPTPLQPIAPTVHYLGTRLAEKLKPLDRSTRDVAAAMLKALAERPEEPEKMIDALATLLGEFEAEYPDIPVHRSFGK